MQREFASAGPFRFYVNDYDSTFVLESVAFSEGRIVRKELNDSVFIFEPHFFIKDHIGSVRAVVKANGEILQQNDYQPYGQKILADGHASGENDYLYCGKEFQSFFDLPFYDSGARFQRNDGIFLSVDPLAEKYYGVSPYAYCAGNPVRYVDKDGRVIETAFDAISLGLGIKSFISNIKSGNTRGAIWDGVGIIADAAAVALPFVPGGAGAAIKAARAADKGADAIKAISKGEDAVRAIDRAGDAAKATRMENLREKAKIGQEAHRQIEKKLTDAFGAEKEVTVVLKNGDKVRKDAKMLDGTYVIIKPDTPSGRAAAKKREVLMQSNGKKTMTIYYDPTNPAYQPGSPTYIGPKK